jgi:hypothetical protein
LQDVSIAVFRVANQKQTLITSSEVKELTKSSDNRKCHDLKFNVCFDKMSAIKC